MDTRKPYPSDVSDEEWAFLAPYLALVREDAPQREYDLREVFNGLRWIVRTGSAWRYMPHDLPPWETVYQQTQRWIKAGVFEEIVHDLCAYFCGFRKAGRRRTPRRPYSTRAPSDAPRRAALGAARTGTRARRVRRYTQGTRRVHAAVATLGHLLALRVSPANEDDRQEVKELSEEIQRARGENVQLAYVDQGYTGARASGLAAEEGIRLEVVKQEEEEAKRGFVLLPRRWVVERDFAWASRFRRLVKDYERLPETVAGLHFVAFACLFLQQAAGVLLAGS